MSDRPLRETGGDLTRALLASAACDGPNEEQRRRAIACAAAATTSIAIGTIAGKTLWAKVIGAWKIGVCVLAMTVGAVVAKRALSPAPPPPSRVVTHAASASASAAHVAPSPPPISDAAVAEEEELLLPPEEDKPHPSTPPHTTACTLKEEVASLQQAKAAVASKDGARALEILDRHAASCPSRKLMVQADVVRVQALAAKGDRQAASNLARRILASNPTSQYAALLDAYVIDSEGSGQ